LSDSHISSTRDAQEEFIAKLSKEQRDMYEQIVQARNQNNLNRRRKNYSIDED
jgi:hypothetical protein